MRRGRPLDARTGLPLLLQSTGSRAQGFWTCGSQAPERRLNSHAAKAQLLRYMWDLPGTGIEPVSSALTGGLLTPEPPGKSSNNFEISHLPVCVDEYICFPCNNKSFRKEWTVGSGTIFYITMLSGLPLYTQ